MEYDFFLLSFNDVYKYNILTENTIITREGYSLNTLHL